MLQVSRRALLQGALATTSLAVAGVGLGSTTAEAATTYGPRSISHVGDFGTPPSNLNYRMWNFSSGTSLSAALARMGPNDCLVLPERSQPYYIDTSHGFNYPGTYYGMARATAGIHGMGPGAVIALGSSSFSKGPATSGSGNLNNLISSGTAGAYFGNFTMKGRSLGGCAFDALKISGSSTKLENLRLVGAHRGWRNSPPGEAGAITGNAGSNLKVLNCEIDCRDASSGLRVGTSPLMFNNQSNVTVSNVYAHHSVAGTITFYRVNGATVRNTRSEHNGSGKGGLNGHAYNVEQSTGTVLIDHSTFVCDYGTNTGVHLSTGSYYSSPARIKVVAPTNDTGPYKGVFAVNISPTYGGRAQTVRPSNISVVNASGAALPWKSNY
jgi:hypothetical protein